jgi:TolB protein
MTPYRHLLGEARAVAVGLVVLCVLASSTPSWGQQREYTEIAGSGQSLYRIAVAPVLSSPLVSAKARILQSVLANDLVLVGLFKVLDPRGFLANLKTEGTRIDPKSWANVGAQAVVKARATGAGGGRLRVSWYLYDVGRGARPVVQKTYTDKNPRALAHRFGDDIVKYYTKGPGIFLSKIAFAQPSRRQRSSQIYAMDFDGYGIRRVSRTGKQNVLPDWSPQGSIAYTSFLWRNPDVYVVSAGGGRAKRISKHRGLNTGAAWSPDGKKIALTLSKDGNAEIYLISPSGQVLRRLTRHPGIDTSPTWSPDGSKIAFVSNRAGSPQIYVMSASGGGVRRLTFAGNYNQEPDWCPRRETPLVAFTGRDDKGRYDIFTIDVKSGAVKRLTQGQGSNKSPSWAPNGRVLVFASSRGGLWISNADGLNQHQIYRGPAETPSWSP